MISKEESQEKTNFILFPIRAIHLTQPIPTCSNALLGKDYFHPRLELDRRLVSEKACWQSLLTSRLVEGIIFFREGIRFHRRKSASRGKLFCRLVQQAVQVQAATSASLMDHNPLGVVESSK